MARVCRASFYLSAFLLLCISLYVHSKTIASGDKLYELLYAGMMLDGKKLYVDIFPVSPPLIFWIYSLPQMLAKAGVFTDLTALLLVGLCLTCFSYAVSLLVIMHHPVFAGSRQKLIEFTLLFFFIFIFRANVHYFLDREHISLVLAFPYLLRQMPSLQNAPLPKWLRITVAVMAGVGFSMRPQWLLVLGGVLLLTLLRQRSLRVLFSLESCVIYAVGICYLIAVRLLYPEYFSAVLPIAFATYSETRTAGSGWVFACNGVYILMGTFLMFRPKLTSPFRQDIYYLLALSPCFWLFAIMASNWAYEYYPFSSIALVITIFVLWEFIYQLREEKLLGHRTWPLQVGIAACTLTILSRIVISLLYFQVVIFHGCYDTPACFNDTPLLKEVQNDKGPPLSFATISIDFGRWVRLTRYSGAAWQTRFPQLWMLPKLLRDDETTLPNDLWIIAFVGNGLAQDLEQHKPAVVFIDDTKLFYSVVANVNFVAYFSSVPAFAEAWKHYKFLHKIDTCSPDDQFRIACRYDVYRRAPE